VAKYCLLVLASPLHDKGYVESLRWLFNSSLKGIVGELSDEGIATSPAVARASIERCDATIAVVATGGTEEMIVSVSASGKPLLIVGLPYANSLPAVLEARAAVREAKGRAAFAYVEGLDPRMLAERIAPAVSALKGVASLRGSRLGVIGKPSPWLVYSRVDRNRVREVLGVEVIDIPLEELYSEMDRVSVSEKLVDEVLNNAKSVEVRRSDVRDALRVYAALHSLAKRHNLNAVTVECFQLLADKGTTPCLAFSLLNSEGLVAGCEADVPTTLTMMLLHAITGKPMFMGNPAVISDGKLLMAHCTAPRSEGVSYSLHTHFESGRGVGVSVEYPLRATVTLARFKPNLEMIRAFRGKIISSGLLSRLHCRTQIMLEVEGDVWRLFRESIGNHYALVVGDYLEELRYASEMLGASLDII
jgi:L-fucose isomerase-like protein